MHQEIHLKKYMFPTFPNIKIKEHQRLQRDVPSWSNELQTKKTSFASSTKRSFSPLGPQPVTWLLQLNDDLLDLSVCTNLAKTSLSTVTEISPNPNPVQLWGNYLLVSWEVLKTRNLHWWTKTGLFLDRLHYVGGSRLVKQQHICLYK